jgi:hypothetical protein
MIASVRRGFFLRDGQQNLMVYNSCLTSTSAKMAQNKSIG